MSLINSCCCLFSNRIGSFISAIYTFIYFVMSCVVVSLMLYDEYTIGKLPQSYSIVILIINMALLFCSSMGIVSCLVLVVGLVKSKSEYLVMWIMTMAMDVIMECAYFVYMAFYRRVEFESLYACLFTIDFFILCLNIYCFICIVSYYQQLREGQSNLLTVIQA